jgi:predicted DNA-binding protein (UPF0278 family)
LDPSEWVSSTATGAWTLVEWRVAVGEDQLVEAEKELLELAHEARLRRQRGEEPSLGLPLHVAAEIVSYLPQETVPETIIAVLDRHLHERHSPALCGYLLQAVIAALLLDTRDGLRLRHRLWCEHASNPTMAAND